MSRELPFIVLCIEEYKNQKNLNGKAVIVVFTIKPMIGLEPITC